MTWRPTRVIRGDAVAEVRRLKAQAGKESRVCRVRAGADRLTLGEAVGRLMRVLRLILVRHGEALRGSGDGSVPAPDYGLTAVGREQARATAKYLDAVGHLERCRLLISSPAPRARETADILATRYSGERAVGVAFSEIGELPDGTREDLTAGQKRATTALETLARKHEGCTLIIVTHSGFITASVRALFAIPTPGTGARLEPSCAAYTEWRHDGGTWLLAGYNVTPAPSEV